MQDKELYRQLMGLREPWKVSEVRVDFEGLKVDVWVEWPPERQAPCPECGTNCAIYDHREERQWRHLDTMQFQTILHCRIPRINCDEHGVKSVAVPWAEKNSRFTALFERLSIDVLGFSKGNTQNKAMGEAKAGRLPFDAVPFKGMRKRLSWLLEALHLVPPHQDINALFRASETRFQSASLIRCSISARVAGGDYSYELKNILAADAESNGQVREILRRCTSRHLSNSRPGETFVLLCVYGKRIQTWNIAFN